MQVLGFELIDLTGVKGVLLDIDNTLYPYQPSHKVAQAAASKALQEHLRVDAAAFESAYSVARTRVHHDLEGQAASHSRLLYGQKLVEVILGRTNFEASLLFEQVYWATFLKSVNLLPEAEVFLDRCREASIKVCLLTDLTAAIQHRKAIVLGLADYVQFMVSSEEAGGEKPAEAMFNLGMEKLGLTPMDCIMVGDSLEKDIRGAEALGMRAYQISIID
jgi:HAD superfamily hydrolase (TIGR01509 family)